MFRPGGEDSGEEQLSMFLEDETADVLEVSTQMNISERRREDSTPKVDADFFNSFDDDFDESDMKPAA